MTARNYRKEPYLGIVFNRLDNYFGKAEPPLEHNSVEQLSMAVILSAQCTDIRVNIVTKLLFTECPDMFTLDKITLSRLEEIVYSTGFYKNKARNLKKLANILVKEYNGKIPDDFSILTQLPGIGRKTANVIMAVAFNKTPGIVVDTHVRRITQRLGLTSKTSPETIEKDLMSFLPKKYWKDLPLYLIFLGRKFCKSQNPVCKDCIMQDICPSASQNIV